MPDLLTIREVTPADVESVRSLLHGAQAAGELLGLDPHLADRMVDRLAVAAEGSLVASGQIGLIGFVDPGARLTVVQPGSRRRGIGRRLVETAERSRAATDGPLQLWLPNGNEGARRFLGALGYRYQSSLWRLDLPAGTPVAPPSFPSALRQRRIDEIAVDAYVDLFNAAFRDHPTSLRVSREQVEWVHSRPDFDPTTVSILVERDGDRPAGFCRVSIDEHGPGSGEIDFVALLPAWRGRGIGRELVRWGIERLLQAGANDVFLQVEGENAGALRLYQQTGFVAAQEWRRWSRAVSSAANSV